MRHRGEPLTPSESSEVRAIIERISERQAREYLGVSAQTIARAVAGMHVQRGTLALIRERLRALREANAA